MLPDYGLDLRQFLFEPLDEVLFAEMRDRIVSVVGRYLPEIEITKLNIISLDEIGYTGIPGLKITLAFKLKNTNEVPSDITVKVGV
jgi:phage baseplate assembly protein W